MTNTQVFMQFFKRFSTKTGTGKILHPHRRKDFSMENAKETRYLSVSMVLSTDVVVGQDR